MYDVTVPKEGLANILDVLHHLVLPATSLAIVNAALYSRLARAGMINTLNADFIRTARAKGLSERVVVMKHALRNALLPVVTMVGLQFGYMFAGAVINTTEKRAVLHTALRNRALLVMAANIITDFVYRIIDPRIRGGGK